MQFTALIVNMGWERWSWDPVFHRSTSDEPDPSKSTRKRTWRSRRRYYVFFDLAFVSDLIKCKIWSALMSLLLEWPAAETVQLFTMASSSWSLASCVLQVRDWHVPASIYLRGEWSWWTTSWWSLFLDKGSKTAAAFIRLKDPQDMLERGHILS